MVQRMQVTSETCENIRNEVTSKRLVKQNAERTDYSTNYFTVSITINAVWFVLYLDFYFCFAFPLSLSLSISACAQAAVSFSFGRPKAPFFLRAKQAAKRWIIPPRMHKSSPFWYQKSKKKILGMGHSPLPRSQPQRGKDTPPHTSPPSAPSAPRFSRLCSDKYYLFYALVRCKVRV